jgi:hypothetical protein
MAAAKQLIKAIAAVDRDGWSAADLRQLHREVLPVARCLAPLEGVHPLQSSEVKPTDRTPLAVKVVSILVWVLRGLHEQHFKGEALIQQACELLCALADVLYILFISVESRPSSSFRSQRVGGTAFSKFLKLDDAAGDYMTRG